MWSVVYHWKVMADAKPAALGSTAASFLTDSVSRVRPNTRLIALLALGHLVIDTNQGSLVTALIAGLGLAGTLGMIVPTVIVTAVLLAVLPMMARPAAAASRPARAHGRNMTRAMAILMLVVTIRSWAQLGFTTFVPFYYIDSLGA